MAKFQGSLLLPTMTRLFNEEPSWEKIKDDINEELASYNVIVQGKIYQMTTVKDVQQLFRMASFDLSKRPKFKGRKLGVEDLFDFETEKVENKELVSTW